MATLARLRQLRWREPPRGYRLAWLVLAVVVLLHLVFTVMVWWAMRPPPSRGEPAAPAADMLEVRFIPAATAPAVQAPPPPVPLPPPPPRTPSRHAAEPAAKNALSVQLPAPATSVAPPRLFDRNGQAILPAAASAPVPEYVQGLPQGDTRIMRHDNPVKYQATRFDKDWGRTSPVTDALQKAVDKTTVKHTFTPLPGIHIHCAVSLAMLAGGCGGDPPPPPSPKDGDTRLNMAPAPLAANPNAPKPPSLAECIAMYRAGKPLADGCPSDTPYRATDAAMREEQEQRERRARQPPAH